MITLNKFVSTLQTFVTNHQQLKSFYFDTLPSVGSEGAIRYPSLFCFLDGATTSQNSRNIKFKFYVADKGPTFFLLRRQKKERKEKATADLPFGLPLVHFKNWEMNETRLRLRQRSFMIQFLQHTIGCVPSG